MRIICAWCQKDIDDKGPLQMGDRNVSHGMCKKCYDKAMKEIDGMKVGQNMDLPAETFDDLPTTKYDETKCIHGVPGNQWCDGCESEV